MLRLILSFFLLSMATGCSTTSISPVFQEGSRIDQDGQRISRAEHGVQVSVRLQDAILRPAPAEQNYCSFLIEVKNLRNVILPLKSSDFVMIDDLGHQYSAADPGELVAQLTDDGSYLLPYPYVGYYYLQDALRGQADNQLRSESSYFSSRRPEYIKTEALPETGVLPNATVAGAIYFPAELRSINGFRIIYQTGTLTGQKPFTISLPFQVEKK